MMAVPSRDRLFFAACGVAAGLLALGVAWELDWGEGLHRPVVAPAKLAAKPVPLALLRQFGPEGGIAAFAESVNRPLLVPTRRPSPPPTPVEAKPQMQRGQFVLLGTTVAGAKSYAFLRETSGGKQLRVAQGDQVKGMLVESVNPTQVVLRLGDETENLALRVMIPPKAPGAMPRSTPAIPPTSAPIQPTVPQGISTAAPPPPSEPQRPVAEAKQPPAEASFESIYRERLARKRNGAQ